MKYSKEEKQEAYNFLRSLHKNKDGKVHIYANITHVSKLGMTRYIRFYAKQSKEDYLLHLDYSIATILDYTHDNNKGLKVGGCGMDMIYSVLSNLNYKMATLDTGRQLRELLDDPKKPCGVRIYDDYFTDANNYQLL